MDGPENKAHLMEPDALKLMTWPQLSLVLLPNSHLNSAFWASKIYLSTGTKHAIVCLFASVFWHAVSEILFPYIHLDI